MQFDITGHDNEKLRAKPRPEPMLVLRSCSKSQRIEWLQLTMIGGGCAQRWSGPERGVADGPVVAEGRGRSGKTGCVEGNISIT